MVPTFTPTCCALVPVNTTFTLPDGMPVVKVLGYYGNCSPGSCLSKVYPIGHDPCDVHVFLDADTGRVRYDGNLISTVLLLFSAAPLIPECLPLPALQDTASHD